MNIHEQIETQEFHKKAPVFVNKINNNYFVKLLLILAIGAFIYYSEILVRGEGYRSAEIKQDIEVLQHQRCLALNSEPQCCYGHWTMKLKELKGCK